MKCISAEITFEAMCMSKFDLGGVEGKKKRKHVRKGGVKEEENAREREGNKNILDNIYF